MRILRQDVSRAGGFFTKDTWIGLGLALAAFAVYLSTLSPSIGPDDSGELAAVAATLGVAHPTGYPLFTLIGWIFAHLPLGDMRVIAKLNLMVAIFCATAVFVFYRLFLVWLRESALPAQPLAKGRKAADAESLHPLHRFAAGAGVLALAFSRVFWSNALTLEVYALHLLFLALTLLLFVLYLRAERDRDPGRNRLWLLFAYVFGLSFANHMMAVLLFPALLYLYFASRGFTKPAWVRIVRGIPVFLLGLTPYLYLPLRAASRPWMNWGAPSTWTNFRAHVTAEQYKGMMFSSVDLAQNKFLEFFWELPRDFGYGPPLLMLLGLWALVYARSGFVNRRLAVFSLVVFATSVFYEINYDFNDVNFRLNAHVMAAFWAACGVTVLVRAGRARFAGKAGGAVALLLATFLVLMPVAVHYRALDVSEHYAVEDYAREMLNSAARDAVVVSSQEQTFTFPAYYLQLVEGVRPDVTILSRNLMTMPWSYEELARRDPELIRQAQTEIDAFASFGSAMDFKNLGSRDTAAARRFRRAFQGILQKGAVGRPVYVTVDLVKDVAQATDNGITHIYVEGLLYHLFYDTVPAPALLRDFSYRPFCAHCDSIYVGFIRENYATGYTAQAVQAAQDGNLDLAAAFCGKALAVDPTYEQARLILQKLQAANR